MNKKIAIVINNSWYAYTFRLNLAKILKKNGYTICFIAPYDSVYSEIIKKEFEFFHIDIDSKGINPINDLKTIFEFYKLYKKIKPDIVLNFTIKPNLYSSIVSGLMNIYSISNITGLGTIFIKETFITKIAKLLYKLALHYNYKVLFQNNDDRELFIKYKLIKKEKAGLVPGSGVDLCKFIPQNNIRRNKEFTFLIIARILKDKGIIEYIEAAKELKKKYKNVKFQILGSVGVQNNTAITIDELKLWISDGIIEYLGVTDNVQDVIAHIDCVVLPSYREGMPRSLLEACAMEKPIITTNVVGCKNVVDDSITGYFCNVKDPIDLANKMEKMISLSNEERDNMGKAGRKKIIKEFDEKIVINKYLESIKKILYPKGTSCGANDE